MRFHKDILLLVCGSSLLSATTRAFVPPSSASLQMGTRDLQPSDFVSTGRPKLQQTYKVTNTLRWEIKSTLTNEETTSSEGTKGEAVMEEYPKQLANGLFDIENADQHNAWLKANPDKLMAIKFYAPWCRACKSVEPKFIRISKDPKYADIPIIFGQISVQHNKAFVKALGILALPSIQIYAGSEGLIENFPCGPSKIPLLKRKLAEIINTKIDPKTLMLKGLDCADPVNSEATPCRTRLTVLDDMASSEIDDVISDRRKEENLLYLRTGVPFFKDFGDDEFYGLMDKARLITFEKGDVIMRQGMEGSQFYVIETGEVEIMVKTAYQDPLTTPPDYLGAIINILGPHNYFGERALITDEPRAASIRALQKTRCFAFDVKDIPASSILSGKKEASVERIEEVNMKYGTDVYDIDLINDQLKGANSANQQRGSVNNPKVISGVDNEDDDTDAVALPLSDAAETRRIEVNDRVISLLVRFKQIRRAAKCFEYIMRTKPNFGDPGESRRRNLLVEKLTRAQREEFSELFEIIDTTHDDSISIFELRRAMESVGEEKTDAEIHQMINNANPDMDGNNEMTKREFMGVMAEAEFYYLFLDTFEMMDVNKTGFVSAGDLDSALCGIRDLISDDRMSIIDTDDMDMQIDYETYADMLLGKPL